MKYKYIIDSSAWVEYLGGTDRGARIKTTIECKEIGTSIIAIAELADKFERESRSFTPSLKFIQSRAAILPITVEIALRAAGLKKKMRTQNNKFGLADAIHLATAVQEESIFVTTDTDFAKVKDVMLVQK